MSERNGNKSNASGILAGTTGHADPRKEADPRNRADPSDPALQATADGAGGVRADLAICSQDRAASVSAQPHGPHTRPQGQHLPRLALAVPAALLTGALFIAMERVIAVDFEQPAPLEARILDPITPQERDPQEPRRKIRPPQRIETADLPPAAPPVRDTITEVNLPAGDLHGQAPDWRSAGDIRLDLPATPVIDARDIQPIRPPVASYPDRAARDGLEGDCDVHLKVSPRGEPFDVNAVCTHPVFERAAERAVEDSAFMPRIVRGQAVEVHGVIYPMVFRLEED